MIVPTLKLMGYSPFNIVEDTKTGVRYMITREYKLRAVTPRPIEDIEYTFDMMLKPISTVVHEGLNTYTIPTPLILAMEKPIDMLDEDWERFKEEKSYKVHVKHNPTFDSPGGVVGGMVTHRFGYFDTEKNKFIYSDHTEEKNILRD